MLDYKGNSMASLTTFRTPYEIRLQLVTDTISAHSKLGNDAAGKLAVTRPACTELNPREGALSNGPAGLQHSMTARIS